MVFVQIGEGLLEGERVTDQFGQTYCSFKGIPYAAPPIGDLRFKAPQPVQPWNGLRKANDYGPASFQFNNMTNRSLGQEDCLYLNVYTPDVAPQKLLPTMVWIHGGGFVNGDSSDDFYGPEFLIKHEVVLVTFNYRLGALGFLCLHTIDIPGNAGIKDQVAALRWVQRNITNFGGDPKNVTIFGGSVGGASVSYHLVSPMSKNLFKRAIIQSGALTNWWSRDNRPRERAFVLAKKLGCYSQNDDTLVKFFKSLLVESFVNLRLPITMLEGFKEYIDLHFSIVNEKLFSGNEMFFCEENYSAWLEMHDAVEIIIGYTEHEGILGLESSLQIDKIIEQANSYPDFFVPKSITYRCSMKDQLIIGNKVKEFYFGNNVISTNNIDGLIKFLSADLIVYGIIKFSKILCRNKKNRIYLYKFACKSDRNIFSNVFGVKTFLNSSFVSHGDDLAYIFPIKLLSPKIEVDSKEYKMSATITKLWTNFVKHGDPTPDSSFGIKWEPYNLEKQNYVELNEQIVLYSNPEIEEINFWDEIYRQY